MKNAISFFLLLLSLVCFSQNNTPTEEEFKSILNLQFSKIVTGNSFTNFGNFASISTDEKSLKAGLNIVENKGEILNLNISGGATKGVSDIFSNGELNSNIAINAAYHWISPFSKIKVGRDTKIRDSLKAEEQKILKEYEIKSIEAIQYKDFVFKKLEWEKLNNNKVKLENKKGKIRKDLKLKEEIRPLKIDSLNIEIDLIKDTQKRLNQEIEILKNQKDIIDAMSISKEDKNDIIIEKLKEVRDDKLVELKKKRIASDIYEIKLSWFSFGIDLRRDAFKLFDSSKELSKQLIDSSFTSNGVNFAYSHYNWSKAKKYNIFVSAGVNYSNTSNLGSLKSVTVKDNRQIENSPLREVYSEQSAFEGDFKTDIEQLNTFIDFYMFYGQSKTVALHLNPTFLAKDFEKPISSLKIGLLVPFQKTEEQSTKVNLEIFYRLNDLFNNSESKETLLSRNTIGIQASFPISFLN